MAPQPDHLRRLENLNINDQEHNMHTSYFDLDQSPTQDANTLQKSQAARSSAASLETIRATPPINIPHANDAAVVTDSPPSQDGEASFMDHFLRNRKPSISFNPEVKTDFGHRQSINEPLPKSDKGGGKRGRSILHELAEERAKLRSHSESTRDHYDQVTGRQLPEYSTSPPTDEPHVGESRFPFLQKTVDDLARESHLKIDTHPMSMTSQSTMSPTMEEVHTPKDLESPYPLSPLPISSHPRHISTSLGSSAPRPFRRTASQRWRDGEAAQQDFFSRAGSLRKSTRDGSSFKSPSSRRGTASSGNGNSVASSFLRGFSMNSGDGESYKAPAVDAEGQTIGEDYVLGKQIGYGGFSIIKEVTQMSDDGTQRKLAVKIVRRNIEGKSETENESAQAEFDHEVELWRFLNHPNILPLEAVYKLDEATFCFIPLNTGGTLFDLVRANRQGLPLPIVKNYAYQLASAIRYLHLDARVVHRDVKLENCLVDTTQGEPGLLRLCDFGMADWLDNDQEANSPVSTPSSSGDRPNSKQIGPADSSSIAFAGGSLEYAPPEIVRVASSISFSGHASGVASPRSSASSLQRKRISAAVDIWAYGVCLYSMVVGRRPFNNSFVPRIVMAILAGEWDREILNEKSNHEEDLVDLIEGCMIMSEKERWDIRAVVECEWLEDERSNAEEAQDNQSGGWRL